MSLIFVTFADYNFVDKQEALSNVIKQSGHLALSYSYDWVKRTDFYIDNKHILDQTRGCGYWLWKPYIIKHALTTKLKEKDILVYIDCGDIFYNTLDGIDLKEALELSMENKDNLFITYHNNNATWTKRDCFVFMDCDSEKYWNAFQLEAGISFWKNTQQSRNLIDEWIMYCKDDRILTDKPNECGLDNLASFKDHRHDQSILTNLVLKYNLPVDDGYIRKYTFPNA
jgi:hypothetical protein